MKNPEWSQDDATHLRDYLIKSPKLIPLLKSKRPKLAGSTLEEAAMNAKLAEGYEEMIKHLEELSEPRREDPTGPQFVNVAED